MRVPKFPKLGLSQLWGAHTLCADLRLKCDLKQSCSPCRKLFNGMWHATCTQGNQGDSGLLVDRIQIGNLTPSPSFGHNLCFKCLNGSCEPILDIYIPRTSQQFKELFNPIDFDSCNRSLKIRDSNSQSGSSLGSVKVHSLALSYIPRSMKCESQASLLACTLVSPCLGRERKARVATGKLIR
jgi:hypothetical protein